MCVCVREWGEGGGESYSCVFYWIQSEGLENYLWCVKVPLIQFLPDCHKNKSLNFKDI